MGKFAMHKWRDEITGDEGFTSLSIKRESSKLNEIVLSNFEDQLRKYFSKIHGVSSDEDISDLSKNGHIKHYVSANKREFYFNEKLVLSVFVKDSLNIIIDTFY
jgi:hypothetical protein